MKITIVGAGNIGFVLISILAKNVNNNIYLFTSKKNIYNKKINFKDHEKLIEYTTENFEITDNPQKAFENTDLILCTYPAFLRKKFIEENEKYIKKNTILGFIPGYGGIEFSCHKLIKKGVVIFGMQRVPYIARASIEDQKIVANMLSQKSNLYIAAIPHNKTSNICIMLENFLNIPCKGLKEYLAVTLVPSNPLLHTVGVYNIFKNSTSNSVFKNELHFYHEWTEETSKILLEYDDEVQRICKALQPLNLEEVISLKKYYESSTPKEMTTKLKSIPAFKEVMVPLKKDNKIFIPDLNSRMFIEDFPFGICIIKDFALIANVKTPIIDTILSFYKQISGYEYFKSDGSYGKDYINTGAPGNYGVKTKKDLINFYHGGN